MLTGYRYGRHRIQAEVLLVWRTYQAHEVLPTSIWIPVCHALAI
jgi:hypothetical protein